MRRTEPLWNFIKRDLVKGENVMVVAHANTLRGLAKIIDGEMSCFLLVACL
jgi:bisphosphoglycerate-dependent phosphoglycerate mutase